MGEAEDAVSAPNADLKDKRLNWGTEEYVGLR